MSLSIVEIDDQWPTSLPHVSDRHCAGLSNGALLLPRLEELRLLRGSSVPFTEKMDIKRENTLREFVAFRQDLYQTNVSEN
jgi:hypothetical protein